MIDTGFVVQIFVVLFGWAHCLRKLSNEKKISKQNNTIFNNKKAEQNKFHSDVVDNVLYLYTVKEYQDNEDYKSKVNEEYNQVINSIVGSKKYFDNEKVKNVLAPAVHIANLGKLPNVSYWFPVIQYDEVIQEKEIAIIYKWFDQKIRSFHPEFSMLRFRDDNNRRYSFLWSPFVYPFYNEVEQVSDIPANNLYKQYNFLS